MRTRPTLTAILLLSLAGLSAGCEGKPQVRYQPGDRTAASDTTEEWSFDKDEPGKPPAGMELFAGSWEVRAEGGAPSPPHVLWQTGRADFPAIRLGDKVYMDLVATIRFKAVSGKSDQAAGILFRVQDKNKLLNPSSQCT